MSRRASGRFWPRIVLALVALGLAGCGGLMFFPQRELVRTPADIGLAWRDVSFAARDGVVLHGWWLESAMADGPKGTVFFLHGNAENISTHIGSVHWLPAAGYQVLLLDYRGFGRSAGSPAIPDVYADIEAGFRWLDREPAVRGLPLFLLGQSIGAALGVHVAAGDAHIRTQLDGVVLDSGIARFSWIAREVSSRGWLTWPFQWPIAWSMPDGYDPLDEIGSLAPLPVLVMHGRQDEVVPFRHGEALFRAAGTPREFVAYEGNHISAFRLPDNRAKLLEFFASAAAPDPQ